MITLTNGHTTHEGTVICGTMRAEHLIPTFLDEIERLQIDTTGLTRAAWENIQIISKNDAYSYEEDYLLEELFNMLDSFAPDGYYFGSHPGDGADYGWWQYE